MLRFDALPAFSDNYIWMVSSPNSKAALVVDPGDSQPVLAALDALGLELGAILLTHHHGDHVGGVLDLLELRSVPVYGPARERIAGTSNPVSQGSIVRIPELDLDLEVADVPGHTSGHVAYLGPGFALVGDTLFAGGCGRVFEGTPEQMCASLRTLSKLPRETKIYCAHEYTAANLRFGLEVEAGNAALEHRLAKTLEIRAAGRATVPSTLAEEIATNIFLRCREPGVVAAAETRAGTSLTTEAEVFAVVRKWKDGWQA